MNTLSSYLSLDTIIGLGFEQVVYVVPESIGSVSICVATNVTLNGSRSAAALVQTVDVTAESEFYFLCVRP